MNTYLTLKALHLIGMVAWFAGCFYIFRLFVYHVKHRDEANMAAAYSVMERKLLFMIMHPAMLVTLVCGIALIVIQPALMKQSWLHWKFMAIFGLIAYQVYAGRIHKRMARGEYPLSEKACRWINEVPTVLLIAIIYLAVFRPM